MPTGWLGDRLALFFNIFPSINVENVIGVKLDFLTEPHAVGERVVIQNAYVVFGSDICDDDPHAFVGRVIWVVEIQSDMITGTQTLTLKLRRYFKRVWLEAMALNTVYQSVGCYKARALTRFASLLLGDNWGLIRC